MERIINIDKKHALNGSFTVEMSLLMPMILFLVMGCVLACFIIMTRILLREQHTRLLLSEVRKPEKRMEYRKRN